MDATGPSAWGRAGWNGIRQGISGVRDLIYPPTCLVCHVVTDSMGTLCPACWSKVRFIDRPFCEVLGTPFAHDQPDGTLSPAAIADPPPFRRLRSVADYGPVSRKLVQSLKYNDRTDLAPWLAGWMVRAGSELLHDCDVIVPVPLHALRFFTRMFNQSAELARKMSEQSGIPFDPSLLRRVRRTKRQVGLERDARRENVRGAFAVPDEKRIVVAGRKILLVDDVYTTGATIRAAAKALAKAGALSVDVVTFARVLGDDFSAEMLGPI
jgi:ComF family protein